MIKLGSLVQDSITGFEGRVTGTVQYLTGCNQALVQPPVKDGDFVESRWFDDDRLIVLGDDGFQLPRRTANGPDRPAPRR